MIRSKVLVTEEIDDIESAAEELFTQAADFEYKKNSIAIMFMDVETDYPGLYRLLREKWDFPIVGLTTIGMLNDKQGYLRWGISVMLLTSDDNNFAVGMTDSLSTENCFEKISETYEKLEKELNKEVTLVLTFGGKAKEMSGDDIVSAVDRMNRNVKVFGSFASDMFSFRDYRIALNDRIEMGAQVFILISGELNPKYISIQSLSGKVNFSYEVTKSDGNIVYRLGNGTFTEALEKSGLGSDKELVAGEFIQTPFVTILEKPNGLRVEALRNLTYLNQKEGTGLFLGGIEEGSSLELGLLNKEDVMISVKKVFDDLFKQYEDEGRDHGTIICCSCMSRFLALGNTGEPEAESYLGRLPDNVSLMGMYSYGEFCPVGDDTFCNIFHNSTFTMLCF